MDISICNGKTILVTGATGLIGQALVKSLLKKYHNSKVLGVVRNEEKAKEIFLEPVFMDAALDDASCFKLTDFAEIFPYTFVHTLPVCT